LVARYQQPQFTIHDSRFAISDYAAGFATFAAFSTFVPE
jgi:hypothetical protein